MVGTVWLVRRHVYEVREEEVVVDRVAVTNIKGETDIKMMEKVFNDKKEMFI